MYGDLNPPPPPSLVQAIVTQGYTIHIPADGWPRTSDPDELLSLDGRAPINNFGRHIQGASRFCHRK